MLAKADPLFVSRLYIGLAHLCLAAAGALLSLQPWTYSGFFYHHRMMVPVHLVTLGWITSSILGGLYALAPTLRAGSRTGRGDVYLCACFALGLSGMVSHFWLSSYGGMVWSALLVITAVLGVGFKFLPASGISNARLCLVLAFGNFLLAATTGAVLGLAKAGVTFLPLRPLATVYAHAHLAALGWATLACLGLGLLGLSGTSRGRRPSMRVGAAEVVMFELGVLGLFVSLLVESETALPWAATLASLGLGLGGWRWVRISRLRTKTSFLVFALVHGWLAMVCGWILALGVASADLAMRLISVYGVLALLGFLSQAVFGGLTIAWPRLIRQAASSPSPWIDPRLTGSIGVAWNLAVTLLVWGLFQQQPGPVALAGFLIFAVAVASAVHLKAIERAPQAGQTAGK